MHEIKNLDALELSESLLVFLASINSSSAELNFPSTPIPLMGFHG